MQTNNAQSINGTELDSPTLEDLREIERELDTLEPLTEDDDSDENALAWDVFESFSLDDKEAERAERRDRKRERNRVRRFERAAAWLEG